MLYSTSYAGRPPLQHFHQITSATACDVSTRRSRTTMRRKPTHLRRSHTVSIRLTEPEIIQLRILRHRLAQRRGHRQPLTASQAIREAIRTAVLLT